MQLTKHPIFCFWYLVTFGDDKNTKISHNRSLHFSMQDGQDGKKQKKNHAAKVTKIPKTKIWDERNISSSNVKSNWKITPIFSAFSENVNFIRKTLLRIMSLVI